ncbi:MAG: flagellin hook IN motif-containing protein [Ketobacteraceae bacterium]|nr:flagellin hook IN motif-containing protein [Ketobacteraceae bacterium]
MVQITSSETLVPGLNRQSSRLTLEQVGRAPPASPGPEEQTRRLSDLGVAYDLLLGSRQETTLAVANANRGLSFIQTATSALNETISALNELRGIAVRAVSDDVSEEEREDLQEKADELIEKVNRIAESTTFEDKTLFDGSLDTVNFEVGGSSDDVISLVALKADAIGLGLERGALLTQGDRGALEEDEAGSRGIQEGNAEAGDIERLAIRLEGQALQQRVDIADPAFGGRIRSQRDTAALTDPLNQDYGSGIAKSAAERINAIRESLPAFRSLFADAETRFTGSEVADEDFSGRVDEQAASAIAAGSLRTGDLTINGVKVGGTAFQAGDASGTLAREINRNTGTTGVTASVNDADELELVAADGRDIVISTASAAVNNRLFGGGESRFSAAFSNLRVTGTLSLYSDQELRILGADRALVGLDNSEADGTARNQKTDNNVAGFDVSNSAAARESLDTVDAAFRQIRNFRRSLENAGRAFQQSLDSVDLSVGRGNQSDVIANLSRNLFRDGAGSALAAQANADATSTLFFLRQ